MDRHGWLSLAACVAICELAGLIGAVFTLSSVSTWYAQLAKPWFTPPAWVFAPAWTMLYALMGVSLFLVVRGGKRHTPALAAFAAQLALNISWSVLFFGLRMPAAALAELLLLWLSIAVTSWLFLRIERKAAYLLVPYLLWVTFAGMLNFYIVALN